MPKHTGSLSKKEPFDRVNLVYLPESGLWMGVCPAITGGVVEAPTPEQAIAQLRGVAIDCHIRAAERAAEPNLFSPEPDSVDSDS